MSVWITSLVNTQEVINLMLEKYKVDSKPVNFALFVIRDNGGMLYYMVSRFCVDR
jgi:Ras association domain-containing protein 2/4